MQPATPSSRQPALARRAPLAALLGALLVCGAAPAASAQASVAQARESFLQGQKALASGQAKEALAAFEAAYQSGNAPSLLFYLAEANRAAGNSGKALELYQEYLAKMPNGPKKADAETRLAELKKAAKKEKEAKRKVVIDTFDIGAPVAAAAAAPKKIELEAFSLDATPQKEAADAKETKAQARAKAKAARQAKAEEQKKVAEAAKAAEAKAPEAALVAEKSAPAGKPAEEKAAAPAAETKAAEEKKPAFAPPAATVVAKADPATGARPLPAAPEAAVAAGVSSAPSGRGMRTAAWVFGAVGVAALLGGGLFGLQAKGASDDVSAAARAGQAFDPSVEDRGKRAQTLQYVCLGAGGAALIGGGLLYALAPPLRSGRAELLPVPLPGGAMASLGVHY